MCRSIPPGEWPPAKVQAAANAGLVLAEVLGVAARNSGEGPPRLRADDLRAAPSDPRATFRSAREWQQWVVCGLSHEIARSARAVPAQGLNGCAKLVNFFG